MVFRQLLHILFPEQQICLICGLGIGTDGICVKCRTSILAEKVAFCQVCGRYRSEKSTGLRSAPICKACLKMPPPFYAARSLGPYTGTMKEALYIFKYQGHRSLTNFFGLLLANVFLDEVVFAHTSVLVPVPLSKQKIVVRGFNQSQLLAEKLGQILRLPVENCLTRIIDTKSQSKLVREARKENVKGAFEIDAIKQANISGKKVLLIDDILTTGATVSECVDVLLHSGVQNVGVLTLASGTQEKNC